MTLFVSFYHSSFLTRIFISESIILPPLVANILGDQENSFVATSPSIKPKACSSISVGMQWLHLQVWATTDLPIIQLVFLDWILAPPCLSLTNEFALAWESPVSPVSVKSKPGSFDKNLIATIHQLVNLDQDKPDKNGSPSLLRTSRLSVKGFSSATTSPTSIAVNDGLSLVAGLSNGALLLLRGQCRRGWGMAHVWLLRH